MKIGFSFGRCVRSLVLGDVKYDDVMCIIARTRMLKEEDVEWVINEYLSRSDYLRGLDPETCRDMGLRLFREGKILEPRANGVYAMSVPRDYIWMDLFPTKVAQSSTVREAWDQYRMLLNLTEQVPETDDSVTLLYKPEKPVDQAEMKKALDILANSI
jgi:hypothetical protein